MPDMHIPARKIGITNRSVSGIVPSMGRYESSLERDLMELLRFDSSVENFKAQPVTIEYVRKDGTLGKYTPDGYFEYKRDMALPPTLFEVKYRADFRDGWKQLLPKFRAAKRYCIERGWRFEVFTEREIRTQYLENIRFLTSFRSVAINDELVHKILLHLFDLKETDPELLLTTICRDKNNRAKLIPTLWFLIVRGDIGIDLDQSLNMRSKIWTTGCPE
jgi:hypothetical protein